MRWLPLLLLWPALAWADPITIVAALSSVIGSTAAVAVANVAAFIGANALAIGTIAIGAVGAARQRTKARKAASAQRAAYNASLQDRSVTLLQANPPHRVVYGRCIVGGDIVAMFTSDKTGVRENGSTYTKADAYKHLVIVVAAHEVQAINDVLIDGVSIGPLDGSGWVTSGDFYTASKPAIRTVDVSAGSYVDVSPAVVSVVNSWIQHGSGIDAEYELASVTLSIGNTRISNANSSTVTVSYTVSTSVAALRVSKFLGTSGQTVDSYLNSVAPSQWTSNHRLRGLAGIVVTLDLEEPRFQAGPPQITVDVSGKKVYDTRTSTTAYSENPALIVRDFLTSAEGLGVNASEIDTTACNTAATACEARLSATVQAHATTFTADAATEQITCAADRWFSTGDGVRLTTTGTLPAGLSLATTYYVIATASRTVFKLATSVANAFAGTAINITGTGSGTHTVTWYDYAAYTANGAFATDGSGKEAVLQDLVETMAGTATYGATWIIQAGAWVGSVMSLGDDDLDGQVEIVQAGAGLDAIINGVRGQYIPTGKSTPVDFDPYQNATFLAADGQALWEDVALPYVGNKVRAANLARIRVEAARDGLMVRFPAKLKAWPLQIGDRVAVTSTEYGWSAKTFRVTDWQFGATSAVILTLQEDAAAIYDLADAVTADPAPNTGLPSPWVVAAVSGVTATSSSSTVLKSGSSALIPRVLVQWTAITDPYVAGAGGSVEIFWRRPGGTWQQTSAPGDATSAYLDGVDDGDLLTIEVRARNSLGAVGPSGYTAHTVSGAAAIATGGNLLRNSSFEVDTDANGLADSWTAYSAGTTGTVAYSFISSGPIHGTYKQRFSGAGLGTSGSDRVGAYQQVTVVPGQAYVLSVWHGNPTGTPKLRMYIDWYNASNSIVGSADSGQLTPAGTLARVSLKATAPATTAYARVYIWMEANGAGPGLATLDVDAAQFQTGTVLLGYTPGDWGTSDLLAEAATIVVSDYVASDSRTSTSTYHLVCGASITNNDVVSRTLLISGVITFSFPSGIATNNIIRAHLVDSGTTPTSGNFDYQHTVTSGEDPRWTWAGQKQVTVAAGATVSWQLWGWESMYSGTMYYEGANLRLELIKR